jgi:pimeloyl-ACP methyl ester carboxylesterase
MIRMARHHNPPPGRLVDVGPHRLHLRCLGSGDPTVVFDAALGASSLSWSLVQPSVAEFTRACAYDRAGFAWSDGGPRPRTAGRIADELHALLVKAAVPAPYVLVGHSFGGLVVRLFAARHPQLVAGLVLIEPAVPEEWTSPGPEQQALLARGTRLCGYGTTAARLGIARLVALLARFGALTAARTVVKAISRGGLRREDEGVLAPMWKLPREVRLILAEMWGQPKFFEALGSQIENMSVSAAEVMRETPADYGDLPLVVITASEAAEWRLEADAALASLSTRGQQVLAPQSGHWVPLDAPQVVVDVIRDLVSGGRSGW